MTRGAMTKSTKPRDQNIAARSTSQKKNELDEKELEKVSGGKSCATGQHIKDGVITT
jgi:bacteriocin-like protein